MIWNKPEPATIVANRFSKTRSCVPSAASRLRHPFLPQRNRAQPPPVENEIVTPQSAPQADVLRVPHFDPNTGQPLQPRFDPYTGKPLQPTNVSRPMAEYIDDEEEGNNKPFWLWFFIFIGIVLLSILLLIYCSNRGNSTKAEAPAYSTEVVDANAVDTMAAIEEAQRQAELEAAQAEAQAAKEEAARLRKAQENAKIQQSGGYTMYNFSRSDYEAILHITLGRPCDLVRTHDRDGWSNIRESGSMSSRILCRVKSGSYLIVYWGDSERWAYAYDPQENYLGRIHASVLTIIQ